MLCVNTKCNKLYYFIEWHGIWDICWGMHSKLDCIFSFWSPDSEITLLSLTVNNSRILFNGCGWCQCREQQQMINSNNSWFRFNCSFWRLLWSLLIAVIGVPIDSNDSVYKARESEVSNVICRGLIKPVEPSIKSLTLSGTHNIIFMTIDYFTQWPLTAIW